MLDFNDAELADGMTLALRRPEHTAGIFALVDCSRDHLRPWFPWVDLTRTMADVQARYDFTAAQRERGDLFEFVVLNGAIVIGKVDLHSIQYDAGLALLGYWLAREAEGRGLMRAALATVMRLAYRDLGLRRLELRTALDNRRSRALAEGLGFRIEPVSDAKSRGDMGEATVRYALTATAYLEIYR